MILVRSLIQLSRVLLDVLGSTPTATRGIVPAWPLLPVPLG